MENNPLNKKQIFWNRKMIEVFIQLYKENVCLYDLSHENYNNQTVKSHALKNIAQNMQQYLPNLQLDDVEDKIKAIRTQLSEEISFVKAAKASGDNYAPKLWCYEQLEFLRKHLTSLTANSSNDKLYKSHLPKVTVHKNDTFKNELLEFEEIQVVDENIIEYEEESEISLNAYKTQNSDNLQNNIDYESVNTFEYDSHESPSVKNLSFYEENCTINGQSINNSENTKFDWLGDLVVSQLQEITQRYRSEFAWDVQCLLRKYILKSKQKNNEETTSTSTKTATESSRQEKTTVPQDIVLPRSSNVSFNISFV